MENGEYVDGSIWFYAPNKGAAIFFAIAFLASGLFHFYQCHRYQTWRSTGFLPWSALLFVAGFVLRSIGAWHYDNLAIFIASTVLLYAAPPVYELANYVTLSRLLHYIPHHSPIHPGRIIVTFLGLSVIVEVFTANGAAQSANPSNSEGAIATGKALLKVALVLQLVVIAIFILTAARFHHGCTKAGMLRAGEPARRPVINVLITLYISSALIFTRTVFRTVEYFTSAGIGSGANVTEQSISPILRYEWFFMFFESTLMLTNSLLLNARHPGKYLPKTKNVYLSHTGEERFSSGAEMKDTRKVWQKMFDPFDICGLIMRRDTKWWEHDPPEMVDGHHNVRSEK